MTATSNNTNVHSYSFGMESKPLKAVESLLNGLRPFGKPFVLKSSARFKLRADRESAEILFIEHGCYSAYYTENDQHIYTLFAPSIIGLTQGYSLYYNIPVKSLYYIQAEAHCSGFSVPLDVFAEKCDEQALWHDVSRVLAQRLIMMLARERESVGNDAYTKIRFTLQEIWMYPIEIRCKIKVANFIQRRTRLSRSRIMNILAALKQGGYIEIESGFLVSVSNLPAAF
ncbi:helix-turn-helix domain-containing protein [Citrobacter werkmanii]|uniref:helix-turn-helix domain-containing protein n=1 Tax=Citrobacter werkmanii TaxID=67827 RepID=UPI0037C9C415